MSYEEITIFFQKILDYTQNGRIANFIELNEVIKEQRKNNKNNKNWILQYPSFMNDALFDIKDERQLSLVISYMNDSKIQSVFQNELKMSEYYYVKGNILFNRAQILYSLALNKISFLASDSLFMNAIKEFMKIDKDYNCSFYVRASININAILEVLGRSYEVLYKDSILLKEFPNFGPIHANRAMSLLNYWNMLPQDMRHENIMHEAYFSLSVAVDDIINTQRYLGVNNYEQVVYYKKDVELFINRHKIINTFAILSKEPYYEFCTRSNLMLNFHFSNEARHPDDLKDFNFLSLTDEKFNQHVAHKELQLQSREITEDFITCRYLYYKYMMSSKEISEISNFSNNKDILSNGILKTIFVKLYNILDKIAKVILIYKIPSYSKDTYFKNLLEEEFINVINSKYLLGLFSLCSDFEESNMYYDIRAIRNKLVHEYISIEEEVRLEERKITIIELQEKTLLLFQCIKGAYINMCFAIKNG